MSEVIFLSMLALIWIAFASIHDIRTRTVPNWISFSLVIFAMGFRFFYSLFNESGFAFFYQGVIGLGIFSLTGLLLYYGHMFSAGDAKLMISLGAVLPFSINLITNLKIFSAFLFLFLISGALYGLGWSFFLPLKNPKIFKKSFSMEFKRNIKVFYLMIFVSILFVLAGFFEIIFFYLGLLTFAFAYLYVFAKTIDNHLLVKEISTRELEEGDWIQKDIKIGNKTIKQVGMDLIQGR